MRKILLNIFIPLFFGVLIPVTTYAAITPSQNQLIQPPYGGVITATSTDGNSKLTASTTLNPSVGGTGTSVLPTLGQVLIANGNGTYSPQATSSLGFPALLGEIWRQFTGGTGSVNYIAPTTTIGIALNASSSIQFLDMRLSTSTSATSTNLFATNMRIGSLSGILLGTSGIVSTAVNGTNYTLISAQTCTGNDKVSAITAAGVVTCSTVGSAFGNTWNLNVGGTGSLNYLAPTTTLGIVINGATSSIFAIDSRMATITAATTSKISLNGPIQNWGFYNNALNGSLHIASTTITTGGTTSPMTPFTITNGNFGARIGINTSNPLATLDLYEQNGTQASPVIRLGGNPGGDTDAYIWRETDNDSSDDDSLRFGLRGTSTPTLTINSTGNSGFGSTTPLALLSVGTNGNGSFWAGNSTTTSATTTNLAILSAATGCLQSTNGLITSTGIACGSGGGATFGKSWEVTAGGAGSANYLAPTTTIGIVVQASSTIGSGLNGGGLTINGTATTTGTSTVGKLVVGQYVQPAAGIIDPPVTITGSSSGRSGMTLQNTGSGPAPEFRFIVADGALNNEYLAFGLTNQQATAGGTLANLSKNRLAYILSNQGRDMLFSTGGSALYMAYNIGLNPTFKLDGQQGYVGLGLAATSTVPTSLLTVNGGGEFLLSTSTKATSTTIYASQSVAIASTSPLAMLSVGTNGNGTFWAGNSTTTNATTSRFAMTSLTTGSIPFATTSGSIIQDNAGLFWEDGGNRLGVGTAVPNWLLSLSSTSPFLAITDSDAATNRKHWLVSSQDGNFKIGTSSDAFATTSPAFTLTDGSGLFVGTTTNVNATGLAVEGTITFGSITQATGGTNRPVCINGTTNDLIEETTTVCTVSTREAKKNIEKLTISGLDTINGLRPVTFSYKENVTYDFEDMQYGFIAEEVAEVDPHLAEYEKGKPRNIDERAILANLVLAVQELSQRGTKSAQDNYQWLIIVLLALWILKLELKK